MTDNEFKAMVDEALDNWDFEAADDGAALKSALEYMSSNPAGLAVVFEDNYLRGRDKWQALDEMAYVYTSM